jgi:hypothetical protein
MKFDFTHFLLRVLRYYYYYYYYYYYCIFPGFSCIQLKKLKCGGPRDSVKIEVALGQQKSAQAWLSGRDVASLSQYSHLELIS